MTNRTETGRGPGWCERCHHAKVWHDPADHRNRRCEGHRPLELVTGRRTEQPDEDF